MQGQKKDQTARKNPKNYENSHTETCVYEQKPIKIDDINEDKEKEVKECVEKMKMKQREVAENNKLLEEKKKQEKTKETEKEKWNRVNDLNKEFEDIKEHKKKAKENFKNNY